MVSFLVTEAWISRTSRLPLGTAVTVELDGASERGAVQPGDGSFWAEVVTVPPEAATASDEALQAQVYGVRRHGADATSPPLPVARGLLRHRKLHSKAIFGVTDDKKHDSYAAQWFIKASLDLIYAAYVITGIELFFALHVHSDNAGSHFKSSKTMFFLTVLLTFCAAWPAAAATAAATAVAGATATAMSVRCFWEFGAPGHGKGVWDGLGALAKRTVKQDIIDGVALTASGRITSAAEVAEHLRARFATDEWRDSHVGGTINEILVVHASTEQIHGSRPQPDHRCSSHFRLGKTWHNHTRMHAQTQPFPVCSYEAMAGMKKSYLFMALAEGVVGMRTFACWCPACMCAIRRGEGSLGSDLRCAGCISPHLLWAERSCARTDAAGVANARKKAQTYARQLAGQLSRALQQSPRVLVAVQNRAEDDEDQYWLGWATRAREVHTSGGTVPGTRIRYDPGDFEIEVEWLQRDVSGGDERRTFRLWRADPGDEAAGVAADPGPAAGVTYTFNSTELRSVGCGADGLSLTAVPPVGGAPLGVVARVRRAAACAADVARRAALLPGVAQAVHEVVAPQPQDLWTISSADENRILENCW